MLLSTSPTMKLACFMLAALMYAATSITAAPVITVKANVLSTKSYGVSDIECVKAIAPVLLQSRMTLHIVLCLLKPTINQNWIVHAPQTQNFDDHNNAEVVKPEYFIRVQARTDDGQHRIIGKTDSFVIVNTSTLEKRESPEFEVSSASETAVADESLPRPPKVNTTDDIDTSISASPAANTLTFLTSPEESNSDISQSRAANSVTPTLEVPHTFPSPQVPSPGSLSPSSGPTYLNVLDVPADSPDLRKPLNPPFVPQTNEPTPQPKANRLDVPYKYAAAGGALLSLIGMDVGGIVDGVIGGTVRFVVRLTLAALLG
ncbi:hypothetical protein BGZ80_002982 [Entomortierella chlamydospora]|uniref:Uncharacterized protein n=1 Tax=Entomortierella chlamydospora TaxID=101097 RepID=A0A9P6MNQ2_9FUNG|nr:hypothetical protein BGZ80_002982 [Entomortierella chlamydospora]